MIVKLYKDTGFNAVNIPDSPILLGQPFITRESVSSVQNRFLTSVTLSCTSFSQVRDVDYCQCDDFYYFVTGIKMLSSDVAELTLVPDFITSAGGPTSLVYLDGITDRFHVNSDKFGEYTESDPYLTTNEPLQLLTSEWLIDQSTTDEEQTTYILSTVDLSEMGANPEELAKTFTDPTSGESVTIPSLKPVSDYTVFELEENTTHIDGSQLFLANNENVIKGLQYCRDVGAETAILAQYAIPTKFIYQIEEPEGSGKIKKIYAMETASYTDLPINFAEVKNKRLLYGDLCNYGILTASGNKTEFSPEDISDGEDPMVICKMDIRPDGKPYFRFEKYLGNSTRSGYWLNAVGGETWRSIPLTFTSKSGSIIDNYNFESKRVINQNARNYEVTQQKLGLAQTGINAIGSAVGSVGSILTGDVMAGVQGAANLLNTGLSVAGQINTMNYTTQQYELQRQNELYNFGVSQSIVVPTVMFPYSNGSIRDYVGNGCMVYRYRPTDSDLSRLDKILTMYGYKCTRPFESWMLSSRQYFNYIQVHGLTVGGNLPQWWKAGIISQLTTGVRIWHVRPNPDYYTNNPIK